MKRLLLICLLINVVLFGLIWRNIHQRHEHVIVRTLRPVITQANESPINQTEPGSITNAKPATPWKSVETKDLKQLLANLRAVGCPEQTIRDLVTFRVCRAYRRQLLDWESKNQRSRTCVQLMGQREWQESNWLRNEMRHAMDTELETLLGVSAEQLKATLIGNHVREGERDFLSFEKKRWLRELEQRYVRWLEEARQGLALWESDAAVDARIQELNRQKLAELKQLLTPEELETFNLRESPAAQYVLNYLPEANSEAEFKKMVQAVEDVGIPNTPDPTYRYGLMGEPDARRTEQLAQLDARLKEALGSQRVAEQQQEEQARAVEKAQQEEEQRDRARMVQLAKETGIDENHVIRFFGRLKEQKPAIDKKFGEMQKALDGSQAKAEAFEAAIQAEYDKLATETIGEKGPELVRKLWKVD
jgi:hypothetical protein